MCVGGFGIALVGSIVIMAKFNSKISDLMSCVTVHTARLRIEQGIEQASIPGMIKWTPERIAEKAAQISEQKEKTRLQKEERKNTKLPQVIVAWLKKHKKPVIILPCVILILILSVVIEIIAVNQAAKLYEESLYGKTFTCIGNTSIREYTKTYTFFDDNTYEYSQKDLSLDDGESNYSFSREGSYAVRFELFSGKPFLSFDNYTYSRYTIHTDSDEQIYAFEEYRDYYSLSDGEDSTNSKEDPSNSNISDNNSGDNSNASNNVNNTTCANGHTWKEATCTDPATCTVCGITSGSAKEHDMCFTRCTQCNYTDFSKIAKTYTKIRAHDRTTGANYDVKNVVINSNGILSFSFNGKNYSISLVQTTEYLPFYERAVKFDCYVNEQKVSNAELEIDIVDAEYTDNDQEHYILQLTWNFLDGCDFYFMAEQ